MKTENLITLADFARKTNRTPSDVTILCQKRESEGGIIPEIIAGRKHIDISKYPPEQFKKTK